MNQQDKIQDSTVTTSLTDLTVADEQANQIKAGPFNNFQVKYVFADFEDAAR